MEKISGLNDHIKAFLHFQLWYLIYEPCFFVSELESFWIRYDLLLALSSTKNLNTSKEKIHCSITFKGRIKWNTLYILYKFFKLMEQKIQSILLGSLMRRKPYI